MLKYDFNALMTGYASEFYYTLIYGRIISLRAPHHEVTVVIYYSATGVLFILVLKSNVTQTDQINYVIGICISFEVFYPLIIF